MISSRQSRSVFHSTTGMIGLAFEYYIDSVNLRFFECGIQRAPDRTTFLWVAATGASATLLVGGHNGSIV